MNEETQSTKPKEQAFDEWALIELFGHNQIVGRVSQSPLLGGNFIRVDVPSINSSQAYTRFFNPTSIYSISPVSEEIARGLLTQTRFRNEPVSRYDLPQIAERVPDTDPTDERPPF